MKKTLIASVFLLYLILPSCSTKNNDQPPQPQASATTGKKGTLLTSLIGEHPLQTIKGFLSPNISLDYKITDGEWTAVGASLSQGKRTEFDIDISKHNLNLLQNLKIVVAPDLSVSLRTINQTYFTIPFNENSMNYALRNAAKEYYSFVPKTLENTTFVKDTLYLYASDLLPNIRNLDIAGVGADVVVLSYNETTKTFHLNLFFHNCCDAANYTFK